MQNTFRTKTSEENQIGFSYKSFIYPSIRNFLTMFLKVGSELHYLFPYGYWFQKFIALKKVNVGFELTCKRRI